MTAQTHNCTLTQEEFLDSFIQLYHAIKDYEELLVSFADETQLDEQTIKREMRKRINQMQFDGVSTKSMEMIGAYLRFSLKNFQGDKLSFAVPDEPTDDFFAANEGLLPTAKAIAKAEQGLLEVQEKVYFLTRLLPPRNTERLRLLLKSISSLFKAIIRQDFVDLEGHISHINHITANRDSYFLINEIGRTVREIHDNLQDFSAHVPVESLDQQVMDDMPDAIDKLNLVIQRMETAANSTLDQVEDLLDRNAHRQEHNSELLQSCQQMETKLAEIKEKHPEIEGLNELEDILKNNLITELHQRAEELRSDEGVFFEIIGNQSFQDLTGQTIKKIIKFIEQLELSLLSILQKYSNQLPQGTDSTTTPQKAELSPLVGTAEEGLILEGPKDNAAERSTGHATSQSAIDSMLAEFGF